MRLLNSLSALWGALVQFGFRLLYNELALTYDIVSRMVSLNEWRCWQRTSLNYIQEDHEEMILELAHGTGNLQIDLKNAGYKTIGIDLSPYMGRIAYQKIQNDAKSPDLICSKAQILPFPTNCFSTVITTFPTGFIFESATLSEIYRVLRDNGKLIIVLNGVLERGGLIRKVIEFLYQITGQGNEQSTRLIIGMVSDRFESNGFDLTLHTAKCPHSYAQVIIACKKH